MINYKNIPEGYEADRATVSCSWGKTCATQVHQGTVWIKPEVNREDSDSIHRTAFCLASAWLPGENTVSPTSFSWSKQKWPRTCSDPGLAKPPPCLLPHVPETAPVQERGLHPSPWAWENTCPTPAAFLSNHPTAAQSRETQARWAARVWKLWAL